MSIMGRFFGTHGSSGAEWYAGGPRPGFTVRPRGTILVKSKGPMRTFLLEAATGAEADAAG